MALTAGVALIAVMVVAAESALVPLKLTVSSPGGTNATIDFSTEEEAMREMGLTKEMMESSLIHADAKGRVSHEQTAFLLLYIFPLFHCMHSVLFCFFLYIFELLPLL